jgi:hypothetical protein
MNHHLTPSQEFVISSKIEIAFAFSKLNYNDNASIGEIILIVQQTLARAHPARRDVVKPQFVGVVTDLILPDNASPAPRPQAFLVEQTSNWTLPTHFHQEHQFQVFVAGGGSIGKTPIEPLSVHYASPHSGYGPLISGDGGISYFTLRAVGDTGAWYLPEQREHLLLRIKKQQAHAAPASQVNLEQLRTLPQPVQETLIEPHASGLAAWLVRLAAHQSNSAPTHSEASGGRFYVVTQGSLLSNGDELAALATIFVTSEERLELRSGKDGLEVLVLQFPAEASSSFIDTMVSSTP